MKIIGDLFNYKLSQIISLRNRIERAQDLLAYLLSDAVGEFTFADPLSDLFNDLLS